MKFELTDEQYKRLWGDKQDAIDLLEYSYKMIDDALQELAKVKDMITKDEIKDHLAKTVYSSGARKSIIGYLTGAGYDTNDIEFAKRNCSARECNAKTFEDFMTFIREKDLEHEMVANIKEFAHSMTEAISENNDASKAFWDNINTIHNPTDDFQIGDWVKYIPEPGEGSTECVEAIARGTDGEMYLCLSNGEWAKPCYCVKYKAQGEERRKLIDKLNEVI